MKYNNLILEKRDYVYLKRLLSVTKYVEDFEIKQPLQRFIEQLKTAHIVDELEIPKDVIRFNSMVKLVGKNGWEKTLKVVIPSEKNIKENKISVLSPLATAIFGYSENDELVWDFPIGRKKIKIVTVYQEENHQRIAFDI